MWQSSAETNVWSAVTSIPAEGTDASHESGDRIRVHLYMKRMSLREADQLENWLAGQPFVKKASVFERTADVVIQFRRGERDAVVRALAGF